VKNRTTGSLGRGDLCIGHNAITGTKVDSTGSNLINACAGTNGLIVYIYTSEFTILTKPFGV
jgi:hypothetical protein